MLHVLFLNITALTVLCCLSYCNVIMSFYWAVVVFQLAVRKQCALKDGGREERGAGGRGTDRGREGEAQHH